jgi:hypothetical protein
VKPVWLPRSSVELVTEAGGDGDLVTALGAAAAEHSGSSLGGHAAEEAVDLAATTTVGLEGALRHIKFPVRKSLCCIERNDKKLRFLQGPEHLLGSNSEYNGVAKIEQRRAAKGE